MDTKNQTLNDTKLITKDQKTKILKTQIKVKLSKVEYKKKQSIFLNLEFI